ncbi:hypothetical protein RvY_08729 [Ramazzottius varieornatus]|uniref:PLAC domain-containing protein n=1 Tax=Ramazzottius varieornatus TaxID=947166 RepID=A0A1D1VBI9_RAMVA|nr:hypothetical protein RvY_08729 [Ramazzottius varieornatus]
MQGSARAHNSPPSRIIGFLLLYFLLCVSVAQAMIFASPSTLDKRLTSAPSTDTWLDNGNDSDGEWSEWSEWSECSRTCDGGAAFQQRICPEKDKETCQKEGPSVRYKLCNIQPCTEQDKKLDFRLQQCRAYNPIPFKGQLYNWRPYLQAKNPCALTCTVEDGSFYRQLAPKVLDGTRCRNGSLDMCVNGVCTPVGCDLVLGSKQSLDACGVCGGDGSLCGQAKQYKWQDGTFSDCSRPCGGGYQSSRAVCVGVKTSLPVDEALCDNDSRPATQLRECNKHSCHSSGTTKNHRGLYQWSSDGWGPCTRQCGGGQQARRVSCLQVMSNGTRQAVSDFLCRTETQPVTQRTCHNFPCPQWQTSSWSTCSATCGHGTQVRTVKCLDHKGYDNPTLCSVADKPTDRKICQDSKKCPERDDPTATNNDWLLDGPHSEQALPLVASLDIDYGKWGVNTGQIDEAAMKYEETPMFSVGAWSPCSASCGHGFRQRSVECKLYIKFSNKLVQLPDSECSDTKPLEKEPCTRHACNATSFNEATSENLPEERGTKPEVSSTFSEAVEVTYSWHYAGYSPCSKSCLGGHRYAMIQCFRDHDQSPVDEDLCQNSRKPPELKQKCNEVPCPPRWNISDFSPCSQSCGGGTQERTVQCVQEFGSSANDVLTMPMDSCPYPPPRSQVPCNPLDCPAKWEAGPWSACSKTCGKGIMQRTLVCSQRMASGQDRYVPMDEADQICSKPKLSALKSCSNKVACAPSTAVAGQKELDRKQALDGLAQPVTLSLDRQTGRNKGKANKIKVGGSAVLYEGTDLRLKCPITVTPGMPRPTVKWLKDGRILSYSKSLKAHIKMSNLGAVKIRSLRNSDSGTYTCIAGRVRESIHLTVLPRSDFDRAHSSNNHDHETPALRNTSRPLFMTNTGSHIQRFYANSTDALRILQTVSQKTTLPPLSSNSVVDSEYLPVTEAVSDSAYGRYTELTNSLEQPNMVGPGVDFDIFSTTRLPTEAEDKDFQSGRQAILARILQLFGLPLTDGNDFPDQNWASNEVGGGTELILNVNLKDVSPEPLTVRVGWLTGNWSMCSKSCGGSGLQVREVECQAGVDGREKQTVPHTFCLEAGLRPPSTTQPCGSVECPQWRTTSWQNCENSECFGLDTAVQRRQVTCAFLNGSSIADDQCTSAGLARPRDGRDCINYKCKAVWTTGPWSQCTTTCGHGGIRSRLLKCVWFGSTRPAGNMCRSIERPSVTETCPKTAECLAEPECKDHFKYCSYANSLKLCRQKAYRLRCCQTCKIH